MAEPEFLAVKVWLHQRTGTEQCLTYSFPDELQRTAWIRQAPAFEVRERITAEDPRADGLRWRPEPLDTTGVEVPAPRPQAGPDPVQGSLF